MIYLDVERVEGNKVYLKITPEIITRPVIGIYNVQTKNLELYIFKEEISEEVTIELDFNKEGTYVIFVGILKEDIVYITDIEAVTVKAVPVKVLPKVQNILVPFGLSLVFFGIKEFIR